MDSVALSAGLIHLGLDVSKNKIAVGILRWDEQVPDIEMLVNDEPSVRRLINRFDDLGRVRVCYEAGPTGFGLYRLLRSMGVACEVIAPALIPKAPGDRVKTDRRDCRRLARLHRAGELVAIRVPTLAEEAVRDLCRTRSDMVEDLTRARNRLGKFLLRHGRPWRGGSTRTKVYQAWLRAQRFDQPAMTQTFEHYLAVVEVRNQALDAVEADLVGWCARPPFAGQVARLAAYRGVTRLGALTLAAEVADWRRFAHASQFMGFCGLVPSEYSSGASVHRGRLTKAGNAHLRAQLVESAWSLKHRPAVGVELARRRQGLDPAVIARAWAAQQRLCARFRTLAARKHTKSIVAAAIARELAGFLWAEMTA
jgi:transposase